jgi:glycerophosphoryl diester phosphodiesterase
MSQPTFDLQGHRGCRGRMPENTLPAFIKAVELGVITLEMDVVISGDGHIVVSHEPWISHEICLHPDGSPVKKSESKKLNLYTMSYVEIQSYDCGMRMHPRFPEQQKLKAVKPTMAMVVDSVRKFIAESHNTAPKYNIEIKSVPSEYNIYQPKPAKFVELVVTEINRLGIEENTTIQSFDINVLEVLNKRPDHKYCIAYLVEKGKDLKNNLKKLTFKPDIYSPQYKLISEAGVTVCHQQGIRIIPWTINDKEDMDRLKGWGCDGGITDYPDRMK